MVLSVEYGVEYGVEYHSWQRRSSSPKRRELALFVLKIKLIFFHSKYFFGIIKHLYIPSALGIRRNLTLNDDISLGLYPREISSFRVIFRRIPLAPGI